MEGHREATEQAADMGNYGNFYSDVFDRLRQHLCDYAEEFIMSRPKVHIDRFLREIHRINKHGHIKNGPGYMAMKDIEIDVYKLQKAFEDNEFMNGEKDGLAKR